MDFLGGLLAPLRVSQHDLRKMNMPVPHGSQQPIAAKGGACTATPVGRRASLVESPLEHAGVPCDVGVEGNKDSLEVYREMGSASTRSHSHKRKIRSTFALPERGE